MKVRIVLTVEMSPAEWRETYGTDESEATIRAEVRQDAQLSVSESFRARGLTVTVEEAR